ncbi:3-deoxy-manno-octulosonate cytidylyltransferase [Thiofilum flexile]|uniref:3-deoxy-manno-octulosonate cytidylyltransferase n=1 Tax=Thiofilum flexile TaxID=125627 RepID=UPI00036452B3|nr:3-deoxy-manno-octulosonate cytidylyltransferase [Thiofilum flexile]
MSHGVVVVIPARFASTRFPGKPLHVLAGKPLIQHVYERAKALENQVDAIIVATDHAGIRATCEGFGATVCMTATTHATGSDRLAEVAAHYQWSDQTIVVNLQGDEPLTPLVNLEQLIANMQRYPEVAIATLATPIQSLEEFNNPNCVKVVRDNAGKALYFSRASIPHQRDGWDLALSDYALRHIGMYAYRVSFLKAYPQLQPVILESLEKLEQLRALANGFSIHVDIAQENPGMGVDTPADALTIENLLNC